MSLKAVARLKAYKRGEAIPITKDRSFPIASNPLVVVPIVMAGESPALFALGVGDGKKPAEFFTCPDPRNRDFQYNMLERAVKAIEHLIGVTEHLSSDEPIQIIVPSAEAARLMMAVFDRMAYASDRPQLQSLGRRLLLSVNRRFERPDATTLLIATERLTQLFATGMDESAEQHLGALLEWFVPADGQIFQRVAQAELKSASVATDPDFDNKVLAPLVKQLDDAKKVNDAGNMDYYRQAIRAELFPEVARRYDMVCQALNIMRSLPESGVALLTKEHDLQYLDNSKDYAVDLAKPIARGFKNKNGTREFLDRESAFEQIATTALRSDGLARSEARIRGDIIEGEITNHTKTKHGRRTIIAYEILTLQHRIAVRAGDTRTFLENEKIKVRVIDIVTTHAGTQIQLEMEAGMRQPNLPKLGDFVELAPILVDEGQLIRNRSVISERLRQLQSRPSVTSPPISVTKDLLAVVDTYRGGKL